MVCNKGQVAVRMVVRGGNVIWKFRGTGLPTGVQKNVKGCRGNASIISASSSFQNGIVRTLNACGYDIAVQCPLRNINLYLQYIVVCFQD